MWNIFGGLITKMKVNRKSPGISACKPLFKAHCNNTKLLLSANPDAGGGTKTPAESVWHRRGSDALCDITRSSLKSEARKRNVGFSFVISWMLTGYWHLLLLENAGKVNLPSGLIKNLGQIHRQWSTTVNDSDEIQVQQRPKIQHLRSQGCKSQSGNPAAIRTLDC